MTEIQLALIQTELVWENREANVDHFGALLEQARGADLIILPEMFSTGFSMNSKELAEPVSGQTMTWLQHKAVELDSTLTGSFIAEDKGQFYNRGFWVAPKAPPRFYDKRHLFRMSGEHKHYSPGNGRQQFELKGFNVCLQICYDLRFPMFSRNMGNAYDLLIYVANWPAARRTQWRTLLQARAIENQSFVVGLNRIGEDGNGVQYAGDSLVLCPEGDLLLDTESREGVFLTTLALEPMQAYRERFPAWMDQDQVIFET